VNPRVGPADRAKPTIATSVSGGIVLRNYFELRMSNNDFAIGHKYATLIEDALSIIALSQCSEEFCNPIEGKADITCAVLKTMELRLSWLCDLR
jgi:hypothetical protein